MPSTSLLRPIHSQKVLRKLEPIRVVIITMTRTTVMMKF
jgi:hypothetical protein